MFFSGLCRLAAASARTRSISGLRATRENLPPAQGKMGAVIWFVLASSTVMRYTRWIALGAAVLVLAGTPAVLYTLADPERLELDDAARRSAPGQFVRLTDGYTHYELGGPRTGPAVVLAAGFSVPYYIWDPTYKALTDAGLRVLRYDYYGRGFSDRPAVAYSETFYVRQLAELLEAVQIDGPIDLVGLSLGGSIVASFADAYPARVRSLVFIDPAFRTPVPPSPLANLGPAWSFFTAIFAERWWADEQLSDFLHPERFPDWPDRYRVQLQFKGFRRARLSEIVTNASVDQRDQLQRVGRHPRPVYVIWGKQDANVPFDLSKTLLEQMPRARLFAVDDSGHLPQWEQPAVVHAGLLGFLREVNGLPSS